LTHALLEGSPAINAGDAAACASPLVNNFDQRGALRDKDAGCDIGAYELFSQANLSLHKSADLANIEVGDLLTYTLTVENAGLDKAVNLVLTDTLPVQVNFVSVATGGNWVCNQASGMVKCTLAELQPGPAPQITIVTRVQLCDTIQNTALVTSDIFDPNLADNSSMVTTIPTCDINIYLPLVVK
jgi:uncharacterized repeat protein (TIGR01451 family)